MIYQIAIFEDIFDLGIGEWGYCNSNCPSDDGYPATGSGLAIYLYIKNQLKL